MSAPPVPRTLAELLDPGWLTAALAPRFPGIVVTRVQPGPVVSRLSTNARFTIECAGGVPDGLDPALCAKGYFTEAQQPLAWLGAAEARFYATLAEATGVRTLRTVYADVDPATNHGVVVSHDVIAAGGTFLDALTPYSVDQTAASLAQLARLHARTWDDPDAAPWLGRSGPGGGALGTAGAFRGVEHVRGNFEGAVGVDVPEAVRRDPQRVVDAYQELGRRNRRAGVAVIHGDPHVGNLFLDGEGHPSLLDWQVIQRNHWSIDVAYHVGSALDTEDRRRAERDLLGHYLDRLRAEGAPAPDGDAAWDDYRGAMAYGVFMWGVTLLVDPPIIRRLLQRLGTAVADHDSFDRLGV